MEDQDAATAEYPPGFGPNREESVGLDVPRQLRELPRNLPDREGDAEPLPDSEIPPGEGESTTEVLESFFCWPWLWKCFF